MLILQPVIKKLYDNFEKRHLSNLGVLRKSVEEIQKYSGFKMQNSLTLIPELQTEATKMFNQSNFERMLADMHDQGYIELEGGIKEVESEGYTPYLKPYNSNGLVMLSVNQVNIIKTGALLELCKERQLHNKTDVKNYFSNIQSDISIAFGIDESLFTTKQVEDILNLLNNYFIKERERKTEEYRKKLEQEEEAIK